RARRGRTGVRGRLRRGRRTRSWWTRRWVDTIESFDIGSRLNRGRNYARRGHVNNLIIQRGRVSAQVQGSRPDPYDVRIKVRTLPRGAWQRIARLFSENPEYVAALKAGDLPEEAERFFKVARQNLFPARENELQAECSCPDWSNPCKHVAAVYYLIGDAVDRDPFMMFRLRGMDRKALLRLMERAALDDGTGQAAEEEGAAVDAPDDGAADAKRESTKTEVAQAGARTARNDTSRARRRSPRNRGSEPESAELPTAIDRFWGRAPVRFTDYGDVSVPATAAALPKRFGGFPMWRGSRGFIESLETVYHQASEAGLELFLGGSAARRAARARAARENGS
ncbi:MAG: SWIM zinc finger family protein, partial [Gammaproteobacteria bacterium]